ncbi:GNAT family N-acetyltransferase [Nocardia sp. NPDC004604]|uniref:GNAT family N-acetyltransferase n=1 Tax=Nocardia sp. NPDC004604 TaxID=3157013 RepID=UPI0033B0048E
MHSELQNRGYDAALERLRRLADEVDALESQVDDLSTRIATLISNNIPTPDSERSPPTYRVCEPRDLGRVAGLIADHLLEPEHSVPIVCERDGVVESFVLATRDAATGRIVLPAATDGINDVDRPAPAVTADDDSDPALWGKRDRSERQSEDGPNRGFRIESLEGGHSSEPQPFEVMFPLGTDHKAQDFVRQYLDGKTPIVVVQTAFAEQRNGRTGFVVVFPVAASKYDEAVAAKQVPADLFATGDTVNHARAGAEILDSLVEPDAKRAAIEAHYVNQAHHVDHYYLNDLQELTHDDGSDARGEVEIVSEAYDFSDGTSMIRLLNFSSNRLGIERIRQTANVIRYMTERSGGGLSGLLDTIMIVPEESALMQRQTTSSDGTTEMIPRNGFRGMRMLALSDRILKPKDQRRPLPPQSAEFFDKFLEPDEPASGPGRPRNKVSAEEWEVTLAYEMTTLLLPGNTPGQWGLSGPAPTLLGRENKTEHMAELGAAEFVGGEHALSIPDDQYRALQELWGLRTKKEPVLGPHFITCRQLDLTNGPLPRRPWNPTRPLVVEITYQLVEDRQNESDPVEEPDVDNGQTVSDADRRTDASADAVFGSTPEQRNFLLPRGTPGAPVAGRVGARTVRRGFTAAAVAAVRRVAERRAAFEASGGSGDQARVALVEDLERPVDEAASSGGRGVAPVRVLRFAQTSVPTENLVELAEAFEVLRPMFGHVDEWRIDIGVPSDEGAIAETTVVTGVDGKVTATVVFSEWYAAHRDPESVPEGEAGLSLVEVIEEETEAGYFAPGFDNPFLRVLVAEMSTPRALEIRPEEVEAAVGDRVGELSGYSRDEHGNVLHRNAIVEAVAETLAHESQPDTARESLAALFWEDSNPADPGAGSADTHETERPAAESRPRQAADRDRWIWSDVIQRWLDEKAIALRRVVEKYLRRRQQEAVLALLDGVPAGRLAARLGVEPDDAPGILYKADVRLTDVLQGLDEAAMGTAWAPVGLSNFVQSLLLFERGEQRRLNWLSEQLQDLARREPETVLNVINRLPIDERECVRLRLAGLRTADVALLLDLSQSQVSDRLKFAKIKLNAALIASLPDHPHGDAESNGREPVTADELNAILDRTSAGDLRLLGWTSDIVRDIGRRRPDLFLDAVNMLTEDELQAFRRRTGITEPEALDISKSNLSNRLNAADIWLTWVLPALEDARPAGSLTAAADPTFVGQQLRSWRISAGRSLPDVAGALPVTMLPVTVSETEFEAVLSNYEQGVDFPSPKMVRFLAEELGVPVEEADWLIPVLWQHEERAYRAALEMRPKPIDATMAAVGAIFYQIRWESGRFQKDLVTATGVSQNFVSLLESGQAVPKPPLVRAIVRALDAPARHGDRVITLLWERAERELIDSQQDPDSELARIGRAVVRLYWAEGLINDDAAIRAGVSVDALLDYVMGRVPSVRPGTLLHLIDKLRGPPQLADLLLKWLDTHARRRNIVNQRNHGIDPDSVAGRLGQFLFGLRWARDLDQSALPGSTSRYETGQNRPSLEMLGRLMTLFGYQLGDDELRHLHSTGTMPESVGSPYSEPVLVGSTPDTDAALAEAAVDAEGQSAGAVRATVGRAVVTARGGEATSSGEEPARRAPSRAGPVSPTAGMLDPKSGYWPPHSFPEGDDLTYQGEAERARQAAGRSPATDAGNPTASESVDGFALVVGALGDLGLELLEDPGPGVAAWRRLEHMTGYQRELGVDFAGAVAGVVVGDHAFAVILALPRVLVVARSEGRVVVIDSEVDGRLDRSAWVDPDTLNPLENRSDIDVIFIDEQQQLADMHAEGSEAPAVEEDPTAEPAKAAVPRRRLPSNFPADPSRDHIEINVGVAVGITDIGAPHTYDRNQDHIALETMTVAAGDEELDALLMGVADGVSFFSVPDSEVVSKLALDVMMERVEQTLSAGLAPGRTVAETVDEALDGALEAAFAEVQEFGRHPRYENTKKPGTTVLFAVKINGRVYIRWVGDCTAVFIPARGDDGAPSEVVVLTEGHAVPGTSQLTYCLGSGQRALPEDRRTTFDAPAAGTFLLISDGVEKAMDMRQLEERVNIAPTLLEATDGVVGQARTAFAEPGVVGDNLTLIGVPVVRTALPTSARLTIPVYLGAQPLLLEVHENNVGLLRVVIPSSYDAVFEDLVQQLKYRGTDELAYLQRMVNDVLMPASWQARQATLDELTRQPAVVVFGRGHADGQAAAGEVLVSDDAGTRPDAWAYVSDLSFLRAESAREARFDVVTDSALDDLAGTPAAAFHLHRILLPGAHVRIAVVADDRVDEATVQQIAANLRQAGFDVVVDYREGAFSIVAVKLASSPAEGSAGPAEAELATEAPSVASLQERAGITDAVEQIPGAGFDGAIDASANSVARLLAPGQASDPALAAATMAELFNLARVVLDRPAAQDPPTGSLAALADQQVLARYLMLRFGLAVFGVDDAQVSVNTIRIFTGRIELAFSAHSAMFTRLKRVELGKTRSPHQLAEAVLNSAHPDYGNVRLVLQLDYARNPGAYPQIPAGNLVAGEDPGNSDDLIAFALAHELAHTMSYHFDVARVLPLVFARASFALSLRGHQVGSAQAWGERGKSVYGSRLLVTTNGEEVPIEAVADFFARVLRGAQAGITDPRFPVYALQTESRGLHLPNFVYNTVQLLRELRGLAGDLPLRSMSASARVVEMLGHVGQAHRDVIELAELIREVRVLRTEGHRSDRIWETTQLQRATARAGDMSRAWDALATVAEPSQLWRYAGTLSELLDEMFQDVHRLDREMRSIGELDLRLVGWMHMAERRYLQAVERAEVESRTTGVVPDLGTLLRESLPNILPDLESAQPAAAIPEGSLLAQAALALAGDPSEIGNALRQASTGQWTRLDLLYVTLRSYPSGTQALVALAARGGVTPLLGLFHDDGHIRAFDLGTRAVSEYPVMLDAATLEGVFAVLQEPDRSMANLRSVASASVDFAELFQNLDRVIRSVEALDVVGGEFVWRNNPAVVQAPPDGANAVYFPTPAEDTNPKPVEAAGDRSGSSAAGSEPAAGEGFGLIDKTKPEIGRFGAGYSSGDGTHDGLVVTGLAALRAALGADFTATVSELPYHVGMPSRTWLDGDRRVAGLPDLYAALQESGTDEHLAAAHAIRERLLDPTRGPLPEPVITREFKDVRSILPERLRHDEASQPLIHLIANGLHIVRTLYGHKDIGRANAMYGLLENGCPATYHNGFELLEGLATLFKVMEAAGFSDRDALLSLALEAYSDAVYGNGRRSHVAVNRGRFDELLSGELFHAHAGTLAPVGDGVGISEDEADLVKEGIENTEFSEETKQQVGRDHPNPVVRYPVNADLGPLHEVNMDVVAEDMCALRADGTLAMVLEDVGVDIRKLTSTIAVLSMIDKYGHRHPNPFDKYGKPRPVEATKQTVLQATAASMRGQARFRKNHRYGEGWPDNRPRRLAAAAVYEVLADQVEDKTITVAQTKVVADAWNSMPENSVPRMTVVREGSRVTVTFDYHHDETPTGTVALLGNAGMACTDTALGDGQRRLAFDQDLPDPVAAVAAQTLEGKRYFERVGESGLRPITMGSEVDAWVDRQRAEWLGELISRFSVYPTGLNLDRVDSFLDGLGLHLATVVLVDSVRMPELLRFVRESIGLDAPELEGWYLAVLDVVIVFRNSEREALNGPEYTESQIVHEVAHGSSRHALLRSVVSSTDTGHSLAMVIARTGHVLELPAGPIGRVLEEGFAEYVRGRYIDSLGLRDGLLRNESPGNYSRTRADGVQVAQPAKYMYRDVGDRLAAPFSASAAQIIDLLVAVDPLLWPALVRARNSVAGLREVAARIDAISLGLYRKLRDDFNNEELFPPALDYVIAVLAERPSDRVTPSVDLPAVTAERPPGDETNAGNALPDSGNRQASAVDVFEPDVRDRSSEQSPSDVPATGEAPASDVPAARSRDAVDNDLVEIGAYLENPDGVSPWVTVASANMGGIGDDEAAAGTGQEAAEPEWAAETTPRAASVTGAVDLEEPQDGDAAQAYTSALKNVWAARPRAGVAVGSPNTVAALTDARNLTELGGLAAQEWTDERYTPVVIDQDGVPVALGFVPAGEVEEATPPGPVWRGVLDEAAEMIVVEWHSGTAVFADFEYRRDLTDQIRVDPVVVLEMMPAFQHIRDLAGSRGLTEVDIAATESAASFTFRQPDEADVDQSVLRLDPLVAVDEALAQLPPAARRKVTIGSTQVLTLLEPRIRAEFARVIAPGGIVRGVVFLGLSASRGEMRRIAEYLVLSGFSSVNITDEKENAHGRVTMTAVRSDPGAGVQTPRITGLELFAETDDVYSASAAVARAHDSGVTSQDDLVERYVHTAAARGDLRDRITGLLALRGLVQQALILTGDGIVGALENAPVAASIATEAAMAELVAEYEALGAELIELNLRIAADPMRWRDEIQSPDAVVEVSAVTKVRPQSMFEFALWNPGHPLFVRLQMEDVFTIGHDQYSYAMPDEPSRSPASDSAGNASVPHHRALVMMRYFGVTLGDLQQSIAARRMAISRLANRTKADLETLTVSGTPTPRLFHPMMQGRGESVFRRRAVMLLERLLSGEDPLHFADMDRRELNRLLPKLGQAAALRAFAAANPDVEPTTEALLDWQAAATTSEWSSIARRQEVRRLCRDLVRELNRIGRVADFELIGDAMSPWTGLVINYQGTPPYWNDDEEARQSWSALTDRIHELAFTWSVAQPGLIAIAFAAGDIPFDTALGRSVPMRPARELPSDLGLEYDTETAEAVSVVVPESDSAPLFYTEADKTVREVRPIRADELDKVIDLDVAVFGTFAYPRDVMAFFITRFPELSFVVVSDRGLEGYCLIAIRSDGSGYVLGTAVREDAQGRGIGWQEMVAAVTAAFDLGLPYILLSVEPDNEAALRMYLDMGFKIVGFNPVHYGEGEPRFEMVLRPQDFRPERPSKKPRPERGPPSPAPDHLLPQANPGDRGDGVRRRIMERAVVARREFPEQVTEAMVAAAKLTEKGLEWEARIAAKDDPVERLLLEESARLHIVGAAEQHADVTLDVESSAAPLRTVVDLAGAVVLLGHTLIRDGSWTFAIGETFDSKAIAETSELEDGGHYVVINEEYAANPDRLAEVVDADEEVGHLADGIDNKLLRVLQHEILHPPAGKIAAAKVQAALRDGYREAVAHGYQGGNLAWRALPATCFDADGNLLPEEALTEAAVHIARHGRQLGTVWDVLWRLYTPRQKPLSAADFRDHQYGELLPSGDEAQGRHDVAQFLVDLDELIGGPTIRSRVLESLDALAAGVKEYIAGDPESHVYRLWLDALLLSRQAPLAQGWNYPWTVDRAVELGSDDRARYIAQTENDELTKRFDRLLPETQALLSLSERVDGWTRGAVLAARRAVHAIFEQIPANEPELTPSITVDDEHNVTLAITGFAESPQQSLEPLGARVSPQEQGGFVAEWTLRRTGVVDAPRPVPDGESIRGTADAATTLADRLGWSEEDIQPVRELADIVLSDPNATAGKDRPVTVDLTPLGEAGIRAGIAMGSGPIPQELLGHIVDYADEWTAVPSAEGIRLVIDFYRSDPMMLTQPRPFHDDPRQLGDAMSTDPGHREWPRHNPVQSRPTAILSDAADVDRFAADVAFSFGVDGIVDTEPLRRAMGNLRAEVTARTGMRDISVSATVLMSGTVVLDAVTPDGAVTSALARMSIMSNAFTVLLGSEGADQHLQRVVGDVLTRHGWSVDITSIAVAQNAVVDAVTAALSHIAGVAVNIRPTADQQSGRSFTVDVYEADGTVHAVYPPTHVAAARRAEELHVEGEETANSILADLAAGVDPFGEDVDSEGDFEESGSEYIPTVTGADHVARIAVLAHADLRPESGDLLEQATTQRDSAWSRIAELTGLPAAHPIDPDRLRAAIAMIQGAVASLDDVGLIEAVRSGRLADLGRWLAAWIDQCEIFDVLLDAERAADADPEPDTQASMALWRHTVRVNHTLGELQRMLGTAERPSRSEELIGSWLRLGEAAGGEVSQLVDAVTRYLWFDALVTSVPFSDTMREFRELFDLDGMEHATRIQDVARELGSEHAAELLAGWRDLLFRLVQVADEYEAVASPALASLRKLVEILDEWAPAEARARVLDQFAAEARDTHLRREPTPAAFADLLDAPQPDIASDVAPWGVEADWLAEVAARLDQHAWGYLSIREVLTDTKQKLGEFGVVADDIGLVELELLNNQQQELEDRLRPHFPRGSAPEEWNHASLGVAAADIRALFWRWLDLRSAIHFAMNWVPLQDALKAHLAHLEAVVRRALAEIPPSPQQADPESESVEPFVYQPKLSAEQFDTLSEIEKFVCAYRELSDRALGVLDWPATLAHLRAHAPTDDEFPPPVTAEAFAASAQPAARDVMVVGGSPLYGISALDFPVGSTAHLGGLEIFELDVDK